MLLMYVALLNDNSLKHIYTLSIISVSFADPVFHRVFRSVCNSLYHIIYSYTHCIIVIRTLFNPIQVKWWNSFSVPCVSIAQWLECWHGMPETMGSIPGWDTIFHRLYHLFMNVCMLFMYLALLNDNSLKYIYIGDILHNGTFKLLLHAFYVLHLI